VPGHDPADYATACARLLDQPALLDRMRTGARKHADGFGWDSTADHIVGVYSDALSSHSLSRRRVSSIAG
jgi:D-inositol-3-phosphate glycosyltransferase